MLSLLGLLAFAIVVFLGVIDGVIFVVDVVASVVVDGGGVAVGCCW